MEASSTQPGRAHCTEASSKHCSQLSACPHGFSHTSDASSPNVFSGGLRRHPQAEQNADTVIAASPASVKVIARGPNPACCFAPIG